MSRRPWLLFCMLAALLAFGGCSRKDPEAEAAAAAPKRKPSVEIVASEAKGFSVGSMIAANPIYVFFDPQCPHCGRLWQASVPLQNKARFVWIPVSLLNASSGPQGAALLASSDPAKSMNEHEASMLANGGGISAANVAPDMLEAVKKNTALFNNLGIEGVPFLIARNARTGTTVTRGGEMSTEALAELVGVVPP
ncbi:MAG: thioredoxin fold domain-containing protein [Burkholderiaceae bacterium]